MKLTVAEKLVRLRRYRFLGKFGSRALKLLGADIPVDVKIGQNFHLAHPVGVVIHHACVIGDGVTILSCVTVGQADAYRRTESKFKGFIIEDQVVLGTGCRVLGKEGILRVGKGTVVGANAVLLQSTGEWEVWAGIPARCIGKRKLEGKLVGDWED
ncbi:MAG: hypothetical protein KJ579_01095 [Verrucomicrobia bacterium]|nr:hypothetical protein [Verrucomicrobiota bacterium]